MARSKLVELPFSKHFLNVVNLKRFTFNNLPKMATPGWKWLKRSGFEIVSGRQETTLRVGIGSYVGKEESILWYD